MAWLYVPNATSSPCAQASGDLNSEYNSALHIGERLAEASATWRGKPQPPQAWLRRWKQGGFIRRLSGLTCSPSTLDLGVASFISSLLAIPARTTALPENEPGPMATGSLHPKSAALPKSAGLILSSGKTCRGTRTDNSQPSSRHWSDWATALRQEYSVRPKLAIPCAAKDCSSWPSARTSDTNGAGLHGDGGMVLRMVEATWEAPSVAVTSGTRLARSGDRSDELLLTGQALEAANNWHAPRANDPEKRGTVTDDPRNGLVGQSENWAGPATQNHKGSSQGSITRQDGKSRDDLLHYQAEQFFRLPSSPDHPIAGGSICSTDSPNTNQPSQKRKLNPIFVEALMRWPTGLSGFERQEMALTRWWQLQLSYLSALYSQSNEPQQASLF